MSTEKPHREIVNAFKNRTIAKDLTVSLVVMVAGVFLAALLLNYYYVSFQEEKQLQQLADEYGSYLVESLELPLWTLDRQNTGKIAESCFNNEQVAMLKITEKFYSSSGDSYDEVIFNRLKTPQSDLVSRYPEIRHNGQTIGNIHLGLTRQIYRSNLRQLLWSSLITMLLIILSLVLITGVFIRLFVQRPLNLLMQGIHQVSRGNYDHDFKSVNQKEMQTIISNFRYMANQIQGREESLAEVNRRLEFEIRQRKKIEAAIRRSEAQLRATFESTADGILVVGNDGGIISSNDRFYELWKMPGRARSIHEEPDLTDMTGRQLKNPEVFKNRVLELNQTDRECLDEIHFKDGKVFECYSRPLLQGGQNIGRIWNFRDITDRKKSIQALRESEERFRQLSDAALEAIVIRDDDFIIQVNNQFLTMFGYHRSEVRGRLAFSGCIAEEYRGAVDLKKLTGGKFMEIVGLHKDGRRFPIVIRSKEMSYYGRQMSVTVIRDISDRKAAENETRSLREKLARSRKMEALGLLAGGVAHDLNNILSGIVSYPELLLMKEGLDVKTRKALKIIQESGERAAAVVNDLTTISRGVASNKEVMNLNSIVNEYLISPEFKKINRSCPEIEFIKQLDPDLLNISGSRLHIRKSIMNLVTNASEAIEDKGSIIISTRNCCLDSPLKGYSDVQMGEYALLTVTDTGPGISEEEIDRIFEPFYTKKVMGRSGTGLGLTVVWNTMQDHGGYINVTSNAGGTAFDLYFLISRENMREIAAKLPLDRYMGNGEHILIVDDEKSQRNIACQMLETLGYRAESVSSGDAAIDYLGKHHVDLIVLDMIMPMGMNGRQTFERIAKLYPGHKAVIASGFSITEDVRVAQILGAGQFVKKPYSLERLGLAIKEELGRIRTSPAK